MGRQFWSLNTSDVLNQPNQSIFWGTLALWDDLQNRVAWPRKFKKCYWLSDGLGDSLCTAHTQGSKVLQKGNGRNLASQEYLTTKSLFCITPIWCSLGPVFYRTHTRKYCTVCGVNRSPISEDSISWLEIGIRFPIPGTAYSLSLHLGKHVT